MPSVNRRTSDERGVALVMAILACVILFALAMLVIYLSTSDLRTSRQYVGDKKSAAAAETGIHRLVQNFDPANPSAVAVTDQPVDAATDPNTLYSITTPSTPSTGPTFLPMAGYSIGGGQSWGQKRYEARVTGRNTAYGTRTEIEVGVGYGPIEITTISR